MKFSKEVLLKLKNTNKKLKPNRYKQLRREKLRGITKGTKMRPRLSIFRSNQNIYIQVIDDTLAHTLLACSSLDRTIKLTYSLQNNNCCQISQLIGKKVAERSLKQSVSKIVLDRGPYLYHGLIKALADGARAGGLNF